MFGEVISVDATTGDGVILGEDQQSYPFAASACRGRLQPRQKVEFGALDGAAVNIFKVSAARHSLGLKPSKLEEEAKIEEVRWKFLLLSVEGRIGRQEFWAGWGTLITIGFLTRFIPVIGWIVSLILWWPHIAVETKRLHDMGRSGWFQLLPYGGWILAVLVAAPILMTAATNGSLSSGNAFNTLAALSLIPVAIGVVGQIAYLAWIGSAPSQPGSNRFGSPPQEAAASTAETFA